MWKPGTKKPPSPSSLKRPHDVSPSSRGKKKNKDVSPTRQSSSLISAQLSPPTTSANNTTNPSSSQKKTKKLSGATMGMRFMQRRQAAAEAVARQKEDQEQIERDQKLMEWTATTNVENNDTANNNKRRRSCTSGSNVGANQQSITPNTNDIANAGITADQEMDIDPDSPAEIITANVPVQMATQSDMYGISCSTQIIGRRSFQNFHKTVENSWNKALDMQQQQSVEDQSEREHITDEELLKRYKQYVKGRGDMGSDSNGSSNRGNVGNLKDKIKRK
mmetsp:Transcript_10029/g.11722  ORF Transcript_10029/g.11722 Transcript_10029/m.11722 type:complete len:277 (-) Transcript_10029:78-908(-)